MIEVKRRLDIYLNGDGGLREISFGFLVSWRNVPFFAKRTAKSLRDLLWDAFPLALAILGPVLILAAPLLAIFTARRMLSRDEVRERLRHQIHQNGGGNG